MKKLKIYSIALIAFSSLAISCTHIMDTRPHSSFDEATVFGSRSAADGFLIDIYSNVFGGYINGSMTGMENATSNLIHCNGLGAGENGLWGTIAQGLVTIDNNAASTNFGVVRKTNLLIAKAQEYKGKGLSENDVKELVAEAKFCRGMYYFTVARLVGRFVFIDKVLEPKDTAGNALYSYKTTANSTESYTLILKDLIEAANDMPETAKAGYATKYAAYSLIAQVALQAAAYEEFNRIKGVNAGAKKDEWLNLVIEYGTKTEAKYPLTNDFSGMFKEKHAGNSEIILAQYKLALNFDCTGTATQHNTLLNTSNDNMKQNGHGPLWPVELSNMSGWLWWSPSQNLVDDYLVKDEVTGEAVRWNQSSQYKANIATDVTPTLPSWAYVGAKPYLGTGPEFVTESAKAKGDADISSVIYANRDARFYADIVYDGCTWLTRYMTFRDKGNVNRFVNGHKLQNHMGITNYNVRKMSYDNKVNIVAGNSIDYHWVIFRTGRDVLNVAEAYLWKGDLNNALEYLNKTRVTHGQLPLSKAASIEEAWKDYKIERRVELFMECDYYFSLLRWGIHGGPANQGRAQMGVIEEFVTLPTFIEIGKDGKDYYVSQINHGSHLNRRFDANSYYMMPIAKSLIEKNPNWGPQNPGW